MILSRCTLALNTMFRIIIIDFSTFHRRVTILIRLLSVTEMRVAGL